MTTFNQIRIQNIKVALETLNEIERAVYADDPKSAVARIDYVVALYCAERTADRLDHLADKVNDLYKGPF